MERHEDFIRKLEDAKSGHFLVHHRDGRAFLKVVAAGLHGEPVRARDVLARLELFGLQGFEANYVQDLVELADGLEHDICSWNIPLPEDARIDVAVPPGAGRADIEIIPPRFGGQMASMEGIEKALEKAGVTHGIDIDAIARLVEAQHASAGAEGPTPGGGPARPQVRIVRGRVAEATQPRAGTSGRIRHHFNPRPRPQPKLLGDTAAARVDFRELNVIQTCAAGTLLAEVEDPKPGESGTDVLGRAIAPADVHLARLQPGRNTQLAEDQQSLTSTIAGQVRIHDIGGGGARIDVEEILDLESVDYSTGHIDFPGTVVLRGTVLDGFQVRAAGDIIIEKSVGNVHLRATGDIVLSGGIVGRGQASIVAEGDIYARFVQSAVLHSHGSIFIEEASMHSRLAAAGDILVRGGRGELIGGTALCGRLLHAEILGARNETETTVNVGVSPDVMERLAELEDEYVEKRTTLGKVDIHLRQIEESERTGRMTGEDQETRTKLLNIRETYRDMLHNLEEQREAIYDRIKPNPAAAVEVETCIHPGTEIHFGTGVKRYRIETRPILAFSRFVLEEGRIAMKLSRG